MVGNKGKAAVAIATALMVSGSAEAALVSFSQTFYNTGTTARRYTLVRSVPTIGSVSGSLMMTGSITATVADMNGNGALIRSNAGVPVYAAMVGGLLVKTLWDAPFEFKVIDPFDSKTTDPTSFLEALPAGASGDIQVTVDFVLSAGDVASVVGTFDIVPSPGPAVILLVAGGFLGGRRRRA